MDVVAVEAASPPNGRSDAGPGQGPRFRACRTYRFRAQSMFDAQRYREKIPEADYPKLTSLAACVDYIAERL